jgi:hypothetical protein
LKRLSTGVLAVLFAAGLGLNAVAAPSNPASHGNLRTNVIAADAPANAAPPANFGSPPSGTIPILYNDHHVYAKPDELKAGRVLAALVRGGTVLIPLRSMFEQMGATVAYDAASKTVDISKPGADVKVTVGRPEVVINGETRPLDVPPEIYQGHVVVPIRVLSEGMGAYVLWVSDRHLVVVRYIPPVAPTPAPTMAPTLPPTPTPAPSAAPYNDLFIAGDYIISPKVYNEFSPGNVGNNNSGGFSYSIKGAAEFGAAGLPWMLEGDFHQYNYPHNQSAPTPVGPLSPCPTPGDQACVTVIGGAGQTFVPAFVVRDYDFDGRIGLRVAQPRLYIGVGYMWRSGNYGYPHLSAFGFGAEKLPDLDQPFSIYGSVWYYPAVKGTCGITVCPTGPFVLSYNILKYQLGGTFTFGPNTPVYIDFGYGGDSGRNVSNAPIGFTHAGGYVGLGLKF